MTPSQLDATVVTDRIQWVDRMIAGIRALPLDSLDAFTADARTVAAAESYLRRALEALLDLGRHVLAKGFGRPVSEYKEIASELVTLEILDDAEGTLFRELAGYRNRMVHFYHELSTAELYDICTGELKDLEAIRDAIRHWIRTHPDSVDGQI